jgi:glycosyltransferase involved in cell wall biosynthesis
LEQGYPNLEYLVLDGGSTDETLDILGGYQEKLRFTSERDRGQSHAINKGLRLATGEVINYLNSDDVLEPGALWKVGRFFAAHPQACWLAGRCRIIGPQGQEVRRLITTYKNFWLSFRSYRVLQVLDFISQPATFWRRQVFKKVGPFDESLHYALDYDFSLRVGQHYRLWTTSQYLASFRIQPGSKSSLKLEIHFAEEYAVLKRYLEAPFYLGAHALHNKFIVSVYKLISSGAI